VTNAVKHFKHEMRGKRRLHKRPNAHEIERCRLWLEYERSTVKRGVIVALGATAARSVLRRGGTIGQLRARAHVLEYQCVRHYSSFVPAAHQGRKRSGPRVSNVRC
jgi:DNA polymerase